MKQEKQSRQEDQATHAQQEEHGSKRVKWCEALFSQVDNSASKEGETKGGKQAQAGKEASSSKRGRKNACVKKKGKNERKK